MRIRTALLSFMLFVPLPMMADTTTVYTYTGPYFTVVSGQYTTNNRITGSVTGSTLASNLVDAPFDVYSWNFTDGIHIFTGSYSVIGIVSTDSLGAIRDWSLNFKDGLYSCGLSGGADKVSSATGDQCVIYPQPVSVGEALRASGTWTMVTTQTPEPSTWALVGSGIAGLAGVVRRRLMA